MATKTKSKPEVELTVQEAREDAAYALERYRQLEQTLRSGGNVPEEVFAKARDEIEYRQLLVEGAIANEQRRKDEARQQARVELTRVGPKAIVSQAEALSDAYAAARAGVVAIAEAVDAYNAAVRKVHAEAQRAGAKANQRDEGVVNVTDGGFDAAHVLWPGGGVAKHIRLQRFLEALVHESTKGREYATDRANWYPPDTEHGFNEAAKFVQTTDQNKETIK